MIRELNNQELADLPSKWTNSHVDPSKYYDVPLYGAFEVDKETYLKHKDAGGLCQIFNNKYYAG